MASYINFTFIATRNLMTLLFSSPVAESLWRHFNKYKPDYVDTINNENKENKSNENKDINKSDVNSVQNKNIDK